MAKPQPYSTKQLTGHLRQLAAEAHDWSEQDGVITKGEALAALLWKKALGYSEEVDTPEGKKTVRIEPQAWAIQLVYDRMEGKTPVAVEESETKVTAAEKVRELAKARLNDIAATEAGIPADDLLQKGPPK